MTGSSPWLRCFAALPEPEARLVCFPHAGGSAAMFRGWGPHLPGIEVHAVRYPGRAERLAEPPPTDLRALAADVAAAVEHLGDRPVALFGHSMGAVVALETARSLEAAGLTPAHLFASGSRDGPYPDPEPADDDDPEAVMARLVRLGGTDPEMLDDPDFADLVLPYILSDGRMFHDYVPPHAPPLRCPVTTIVGDRDADADRRPWRTLTAGPVRSEIVAGDHFYLAAEPPFELVRAALTGSSQAGGR